MDCHGLAEVLFDDGFKGVRGWECQVAKCRLRSLYTACQWRAVVGLKVGHSMLFKTRFKVCVCLFSFCNSLRGELGVSPDGRAVAVESGPVALHAVRNYKDSYLLRSLCGKTYIPSWGSVVAFGSIVIALTMATHD